MSAQVIGHRRPVCLVLGEQLVAEGLARRIEHHGNAARLIVLEKLQQHVQHPEHRSGRLAARVGQRRQGVKRPVDIRGAVDENQVGGARHARVLRRAASIAEGAGHKSRAAGQPSGPLARYEHMREGFSAIAANRFGLGARPGELAAIADDGRDWLEAQLRAGPPVLSDPQLRSSQETLAQAQKLRQEIRAQRKSAEGATAPGKAGADDAAAAAAAQALPQFLRPIYLSEVTARLRAAVATERPFIERLTQFWGNHFAVSVDKQLLSGLAGSFEREAIRPHVLGNFSGLLLRVETHAAMLLYLDNHLSVGPHSQAALRLERRAHPRRLGINENLAREILELHTLGVGGGYTQADVTAFAEVITGWSIGGEGGGAFVAG